jgi:benzylsuccinate CoA-transferase BbsF subunit
MGKGALEGIKAISMGSVWAGPYVGRVLAELGAEVYRIVLFGGPVFPPQKPEVVEAWIQSLVERGMSRENAEIAAKPDPAYAANYNCNTLGVGIDLRNERGKELYKELVKHTDIIIDGWSPRVMSSLGLDYAELVKIKPDIIYVSIPALGMTGPEKDVRMWGTGCEALSGMDSVRGYPGDQPYPSTQHIPDPIAAIHILTAILAALNYRAETGKGQHIDVSQTECATAILGEAIMDYSMNRRIATPQGNRHAYHAPHGCYRCKGDDMWVTIAVTNEEEWECFCTAIGNPDWTKETKFEDMVSRWRNQGELDKLVELWTSQHDHYAVQQILQQFGVAAAAVVTMEEHITRDPQIKDRDIYQRITYHDNFADPIFRVPWVLPRSPTKLNQCSPYVGQHNDYVFGSVLGISQEEIDKLTDERIIGKSPPGITV